MTQIGQQNNWSVVNFGVLQFFKHAQAVNFGQHDVQQNQVVSATLDFDQALFPIHRRINGKAFFFKNILVKLTDISVVFDNKNFFGGHEQTITPSLLACQGEN